MEVIKKLSQYAREYVNLACKKETRSEWLVARIKAGLNNNLINNTQADSLRQQAHEDNMQKYIFDLAVAGPVIEFSPLLSYPLLWWITNGNIVTIGIILGSPLATAGIFRTIYTGTRYIVESVNNRKVDTAKTRLLGLGIAPFKIIGSLSLPMQMATSYPDMARFLVAEGSFSSSRWFRKLGAPGNNLANRINRFSNWLINKNTDPVLSS